MSSNQFLLLSLLFTLISSVISQSIIRFPSDRNIQADDDPLYCDSWRVSVETNNAGSWSVIPSGCVNFVKEYMKGNHYLSDSEVVACESLAFAESLDIAGDGKDAWVFDVDETLLSNLPYYEDHGFGSEIFDEASFDDWVDLANAPALPASLNLYKKLKNLGFTLFVLTGRSEYQRNATSKNLLFSGFTGWEKLILRGPSDQGVPATVYKSQKRKQLVDDGYRIRGNSGDQWSDLLGYAVAERSFKLPNPMYYIA